jgi:RNase adaptor protein for sRNA GlmZ degradation
MTRFAQPPEETFCLTCGPDAVLERRGAVLHCPRCGIRQPVPDFPLFVVTGASGTGKTTITEPLRRVLPGFDVFDTDIILQVAALGWDTWRNTWLRLAHAIALNGRVTVLCGSLMPSQMETLPARKLVGPIHFCTLDCPDTVLADRLHRRPSWRGTSTEEAIARHQRFAAWLRAHIQPCYDTSQLTPAETAERIAIWISRTTRLAPVSPLGPAGPGRGL